MNTLIIILTVAVCFLGLFFSIQTLLETRKKSYNEYLSRKRDSNELIERPKRKRILRVNISKEENKKNIKVKSNNGKNKKT